jgi:hypothetical protein
MEVKERFRLTNPSRNGFRYPPDSLEGICWLAGKGKLDGIKVQNETHEIAGVKINSVWFITNYLKGANERGEFLFPLTQGDEEYEIEVKHFRENHTLWLPYEVSKEYSGSIPKFRMAPEGEYDPSEGEYNPRLRETCDYCKALTTELLAILKRKSGEWIAAARIIFHCGYLQIKEVTYF